MQIQAIAPDVTSLTSAPLRNRVRAELAAPPAAVWELVGDLERFPEYSAGLSRVDAMRDASGKCTGYVCHFRPQEEGGESVSHREDMRWYEPNCGYASSGEEPNAFGLTNSLALVTLEPSTAGTALTLSQYYDSQDLAMSKAIFDEALADIARRLVARFGGRVLE